MGPHTMNPRGLLGHQSRRYIFRLFTISVFINYIWEMVQMPLYEQMPVTELSSWLFCFWASLGDGVITIVIWILGYFIYRSQNWFLSLSPWKVIILLVSGGAIAIAIELHALATSLWKYSSYMPVLPLVGIGIAPFVQLIILPLPSMLLARKLIRY